MERFLLCLKVVVVMKNEDHLSEDKKKELNKIRRRKRNKKNRGPYDNLSYKDYQDLMGMNRDTYERKGGAIRRK